MSDGLKTQIELSADASGVEAGVGRAKRSLADLGKAASGVGQQTKAGLEGATGAAEKFTATQLRGIESIKRQSIAVTEGRAALLEYKAATQGITEAAGPYIARIRDAEKAQIGLGLSAKQTAFALRGVPAQFTDIVTSLQGGQRPMQVLLQQGGQLKDMFGGIGPAARALGGYVAGLVTPFTVGAAALGGIAYAASEGAKELREFQNAATMTGGAIGLSTSQFVSLRDSIASVAGTRGKAAETLTEIAQNGRLAGASVQGIAEAAILMEKATGQSIKKTVEQFGELAKTPLESAIKLNEQYHFLTVATYQQIKALEDQGRTAKAAEVAERSLAESLKGRAQSVIDSAGVMEKAWRGIIGTAKAAWDAMLGVGRDLSTSERIAQAKANVARIEAQIAAVGSFGETGGGAAVGGVSASRKAALKVELGDENLVLASLQERLRLEQRTADSLAAQADQVAARARFDKDGLQYLSKREKMEREIAQARNDGLRAGYSEAVIQKKILGIREQYKESGSANSGEMAVQSLRARIAVEEEYIERLRQHGLEADKTTEGEKAVARIQHELQTSIKGTARAYKEQELAAAQQLVVREKERDSILASLKAQKEAREETERQITAVGRAADSIADQARAQEAANAVWGKGKTAIEAMELAQMRATLAQAEGSDRFDPKYIAALNAKVDAQQRFVDALNAADFKGLNEQALEYSRSITEQSKIYEDELRLVSLTAIEREKLLAVRKVELEIAKRLAEVDRSSLTQGQKDTLRASIVDTGERDKQLAVQKVIVSDWQKTSDSINQSLTDALLRGFESGKGFARNLRDTLINMFKTMVLRPTISAALNPVANAVNGFVQPIVSGITNGIASSIGLGNLAPAAGMLSGGSMFGTAAGATLSNGLVSGFGTNMANIATLAEGGSMLGAIGAAAPYLAIAAVAVSALLKDRGGPKADGRYGADLVSGIGSGDNSLESGAKSLVESLQSQYATLAKSFGATAAIQFGAGISRDPKGTSPTFLDVVARRDGELLFNSQNRSVGRSDEDLTAAIAASTTETLIAALKASDLAPKFRSFFDTLADDADTAAQTAALSIATNAQTIYGAFEKLGPSFAYVGDMAVQATSRLIDAGGGIEKLSASLSSYYDNFYTAEEKRQNVARSISDTLADSGVSLSPDQLLGMSRGGFRSLVEEFAAMGDAGESTYLALIGVNGAFASISDSIEQVPSVVQSIADSTSAAVEAAKSAKLAFAELRQEIALRGVTDAVTKAQDSLTSSLATLRTAYDGQNSILQSVIDKNLSWADSLKEARLALDQGPLSGISGREQYLRARSALTGATPENSLGLVNSFLEAAKTQSRTGLDYLREVAKGRGVLSAQESVARGAASEAQQQIDAMKGLVSPLIDLTDGVVSLRQAIIDARDAKFGLGLSQLNQSTYGTSQATAGTFYDQFFKDEALRRGGDPAMIDQIGQFGGSIIDYLNSLPGYARGGLASGLSIVGEKGPELVDFNSPARIYNASQTAGMFATNAQLLDQMAKLTGEVQQLRAVVAGGQAKIAEATDRSAKTMDRWDVNGLAVRNPRAGTPLTTEVAA